MKQLMMEAITAKRSAERNLPQGYTYQRFDGTQKDIDDWKSITEEVFAPEIGKDLCWQLMIEEYPDCIPLQDIHFIANAEGKRVATITTITHRDGSGYVHMVQTRASERGKGLGHSMARYALRIFEERGVSNVILTTDDFRLAAIKTYLDAGFQPVIYHDSEMDMKARWEKVLSELKYENVEFLTR